MGAASPKARSLTRSTTPSTASRRSNSSSTTRASSGSARGGHGSSGTAPASPSTQPRTRTPRSCRATFPSSASTSGSTPTTSSTRTAGPTISRRGGTWSTGPRSGSASRRPRVAERRAEVVWEGDLLHGSGTIVSTGSGAFGGLPVSWAARTEESGGKTSPEELIAAAHAACFSMALSHGLAQSGHAPEELRTSATVTFQPGEGITKIALTVEGRVPGADDDAFLQAAEAAKKDCPVSKALAGVPEITLSARLEG